MGNPRCVCGHEDRFHLDGPGMSNWGTESCECCDCKKFIHDKNAITLESQLTQLKADNAKLREGMKTCPYFLGMQYADNGELSHWELGEKETGCILWRFPEKESTLLEQTSQSPNKE